MVFVLLYSGRSPMARAIRWQTRSRYSHAAVAFDDGTLFESVAGRGVIKRRLARNDFTADWYVVELKRLAELKLRDWLQQQVGKPYDWLGVARFLSRRRLTHDGKWFCSELVYHGLARIGVPLLARTESWEVSPGLLSRSCKLKGPVDNALGKIE